MARGLTVKPVGSQLYAFGDLCVAAQMAEGTVFSGLGLDAGLVCDLENPNEFSDRYMTVAFIKQEAVL